jgi:exopolysaccharide transport family protein
MTQLQSSVRDVDVDLGRLFASLRRDWRRILGVAIAASLVALLFAMVATPSYRAETRLLIETRESVFTRPQGDRDDTAPVLDEEGVTSQVEIITSTDILKQVAKKLDLASRPEFDSAGQITLLDRLLILAGVKSNPDAVPAEERVLTAFRDHLTVYRVERSRVIVIEFTSEDPVLAAEVPNAIADAYLAVSREAKSESTSAATEWLEPEIKALTERVKEAEAKVAAFRAESDLPLGQNNAAIATQQLSELASELSRVRANRAAAEGTAAAVRDALKRGGPFDTFPDVQSSGLMQRLMERRVELSTQIADLSTTLLNNHPRIRALRTQLADLDRQIAAEGRKVLEAQVQAAQTAQKRENEIVAELNRQKVEAARVSEKEVELRALERDAAAQRALLESYLARYREAASRRDGNYLPADARIFSRAVVPLEPYFPKVVPIVSAAFVGSLLLMSIATLMMELFSGRAMHAAPRDGFEPVEEITMPQPAANAEERRAGLWEEPEITQDGIGLTVAQAARRLIARGVSRAMFVSPEGDQGAASAVLVARSASDAGLRVLLIDLTENGAASAPMLDGVPLAGITNLLAAEAKFVDVIHADRYSGCHVIPSGTADPVRAMRAIERLPIIADTLGAAYDLLVIECGPVGPENIRRLVTEGTEVFLSVVEPNEDVRKNLRTLEEAGFTPR